MKDLKIEYIDIKNIIPYVNNAKDHPDWQVNQIVSSIQEFGFNDPIAIDDKNTIIEGHGRLKAALKMDMKKVPVIKLGHLSEAQKKAYIIAHNKLTMNTDFDFELLKAEINFLDDEGVDIELLGFTDDELSDFFKDEISELKSDPHDEIDVEIGERDVKIKKGDLIELGRHRLMCGSSIDSQNVFWLMEGFEKPEIIFTDPPYGIDAVSGGKAGGGGQTRFGKEGGGDIVNSNTYMPIKGDNSTKTAKDFFNLSKELGFDNYVIWGGNYFTDFLPPSRVWLVWDKDMAGNFSQAEMAWTSFEKGGVKIYDYLWDGLRRKGDRKSELKKRIHPTQKPVGLFVNIFNRFLKDYSVIYDGFGGSGSTLIACEKTDKKCLMMELEEYYCDVIVQRWCDFIGDNNVKINGKIVNWSDYGS